MGNGKKILIALGGNAIKQAHERGTYEEQMRNVNETCDQIVEMIRRGHRVAITHGNGPQVGALLIQQEEGAGRVPPQPMDVAGAMTQGQIGFMLQQTLQNKLRAIGLNVPIATVITQVLVNKDDPDFHDPHKPVGPFYDQETAERYKKEKDYYIRRVKPTGDRPYRRVVPSPDPIATVERDAVKCLFDSGIVVIASGGGGIPVIDEDGELVGVEAVIDKDLAGERMAEVIKPDLFLILTDIEKAKLNFGKANEKDIDKMTVSEAKRYLEEGHFLVGSMGPKVEACIRFIEEVKGERAIITSLDKAFKALEGETGTAVFPD